MLYAEVVSFCLQRLLIFLNICLELFIKLFIIYMFYNITFFDVKEQRYSFNQEFNHFARILERISYQVLAQLQC